jgi:hypothetical protein
MDNQGSSSIPEEEDGECSRPLCPHKGMVFDTVDDV